VLAQELAVRIPITENGKRKKTTKQRAIVKQLVNKAAGGDLRATHAIIKETRETEDTGASADDALAFFDTPNHQEVMDEIVRRIRLSDPTPDITEPAQNPKTKKVKYP
jgi:hypothetical protein